jgi:hypothetical protein
MSSTFAEAVARVRPPAVWRRISQPPLARWQVALTAAAVGALAVYGLSTFSLSREPWLDAFMGSAMRIDVVANLAAAAIIATGLVVSRPILVMAGGALVLWAALQQGSGIGWLPSALLPWALSWTAAAMLIAAARLGRWYVVLTVAGLAAFGFALVGARAWAALDFAVAAFGTILALALIDLAWRALRGAPLP